MGTNGYKLFVTRLRASSFRATSEGLDEKENENEDEEEEDLGS
jgi:hypothetical protein